MTSSSDKTYKIWDLIEGKLLKTVSAHANTINSICLNFNDSILLTGS